MEVRVRRGGMLTTVQDLGRPGRRSAGVPVGGAMDALALRLANLLVGNPEDAPGLEMTFVGPELEFPAGAVVAQTGAASIGGEGLETWRLHRITADTCVRFGRLGPGCRAYLAVAGGFTVPEVLGGRGTDVRAGWGGWQGRALRDGDTLPVAAPEAAPRAGHWRIDPRLLPPYAARPVVLRAIPGAQADEFADDWWTQEFSVRPQSDRMGVRLAGAALRRSSDLELDSTAVAPGTVQVPPDGQPIVLGADAQTIGGYPQLAHVITTDLPLLAQLGPGDTVRFAPVTLAEAHASLLAREQALTLLRRGLAEKRR